MLSVMVEVRPEDLHQSLVSVKVRSEDLHQSLVTPLNRSCYQLWFRYDMRIFISHLSLPSIDHDVSYGGGTT